jgi:hypothetical protein
MAFWKLAYNQKWVTTEQLRLVVKTEERLNGEITVEEYKDITGMEF